MMITLKEIAEMSGVSVTTVSNILNGKTKASEATTQKVLELVARTGYKPNYVAQGLRRKRTRTIAVIAEDIAQFTSPSIIEGIMEYCEKCGYHVFVSNLRLYARWKDTWYNQEEAYYSILNPILHDIQSMRPDGVIYVAGHGRVIRCLNEDFNIPAVMAYAISDSKKIPSVIIDDEQGAYEVAKYLLDKGHTKIGVIGGRAENMHTQSRFLGFQKALFEKGVPYNPNLVYCGKWDRQSGYDGMKCLLEKDPSITAVFCISDEMSGGVYDYLLEIGKEVGKDFSVASFDDREIAEYFVPGLTTTRLPLTQIGKISAELLIDKIENEKENPEEPYVRKVPCKFVERKSVKDNRCNE